MTAKIAPDLMAVLRAAHALPPGCDLGRATTQARALFAVARSAEAWRMRSKPVGMTPSEFLRHPDLNASAAESRCARALARLARVSGRSSRGSRRGGR